jgi:D-glycero-alpha-D-manno-heptose-7-phosphate kinase
MNKVTVRAPVRADLAGGTLDMWPLYLFHPGSRTVNVAISFYAESAVTETGDGAIEINLTDQQYRQRYESMQELSADPKAALIFRAVEHFHLNGISITTRTDAPRGSGLGGSSALSITLVRALSELAGKPLEGVELINTVRDLETRLLGVPAGIQDYYPPVFGGLASLHLVPGAPIRHPISTPVTDLAAHMLMHYTGVAHFSGTNNWEMYKRQIDGKKRVQKGLSKIAESATEMEKALEAGDFKAAGVALGHEWANRKALIDGISTPEIDAAISAAIGAGAWAGKVCGAGGGGCIVFLFPPENRQAIVEALGTVPGRVLDVAPVANGMTLYRGDDAHSTSTTTRPRIAHYRVSESVEQLYMHGGTGDYKPMLLAEAIVTIDDPRSGIHQTNTRAYAAPIEPSDGAVLWQRARVINPDKMDLRVSADPDRRVATKIAKQSLAQTVAEAEEPFKQFVSSSEKLRVFHNPTFAMYSEANETREAFVERCLEEARRRVDEETERLESTFRRRMDQLRERSEREQRDIDDADPNAAEEPRQDVNVAWGQTLYNITSGRSSAVTDPPQSVREFDYRENIAQVQKAWDRELQALREDLNGKAREVEEISIAATSKNVEVTKFMILWAGSLS